MGRGATERLSRFNAGTGMAACTGCGPGPGGRGVRSVERPPHPKDPVARRPGVREAAMPPGRSDHATGQALRRPVSVS